MGATHAKWQQQKLDPWPLGAQPDAHSNSPNVLFATRWSWERAPWNWPADNTLG